MSCIARKMAARRKCSSIQTVFLRTRPRHWLIYSSLTTVLLPLMPFLKAAVTGAKSLSSTLKPKKNWNLNWLTSSSPAFRLKVTKASSTPATTSQKAVNCRPKPTSTSCIIIKSARHKKTTSWFMAGLMRRNTVMSVAL